MSALLCPRPAPAHTVRAVVDRANPINAQHLGARGVLANWLVLPGGKDSAVLHELVTRRREFLSAFTNPASATSGVASTTLRRGGFGEIRLDAGDLLRPTDHPRFSFTDGAGVDRPFSLMCWLYLNASTVTHGLMTKDAGGVGEWDLWMTGSVLYLKVIHGGGSTIYLQRGAPLTTGAHQATWFHVCATYNGSELATGIKLYFNGGRVDNQDASATPGSYTGMSNTATRVQLGGMNDGSIVNGKMDDLRLYNYELPERVIRTIYLDSKLGYPGYLQWVGSEAFTGAPALLRRRGRVL